jgi:hypothetical protein
MQSLWKSLGNRKCRDCGKTDLVYFSLKNKYECKKCASIRAMNYSKKNREKSRKYNKDYRRNRKMETFNHYCGGDIKCQCCGDKHIEFLSLDHINGGGNKHRRESGLLTPTALYGWLKRNNYPKEYRVLCMNCNWSRGLYGYCPHERELK